MAERNSKFLAGLSAILGIFIFGIGQFFVISPARAAIFSLESATLEARGQEPIKVSLMINTENDAINAVEGVIKFPAALEAVFVETTKSLVSFWVEEPRLDKVTVTGGFRQVAFSGVMAGGVSTRAGHLFSLYLQPTSSLALGETFLVQLTGVKAVTSNGLGTVVSSTVKNISFRLAETALATESITVPITSSLISFDILPPMEFVPVLGRNETVFDNQWFVAFSTQDSGSGIDYYEVQEAFSTDNQDSVWVKAASPYLLKDQSLKANIFVKAIDKNGNFRVELVSKKAEAARSNFGYVFAGILLVICLLIAEIWRIRHRRRISQT
ncbi:MAG: hypothetical protein Q7K39_02975 [Candidatus Magasanikbacteria bacterium]|nr:hypothetical protein [Candidatus Magasanikbacteria bacterium]